MAPRRREFLILGVVALGAAALGGVGGAIFLQARSGAADLLASSFPDLSGRARRMAEWQGTPLLVNFWATWCAPCREEIPLLNGAAQRPGPRRVQVVGIALDNAANIGEFSKSVKIEYPVLLGGSLALDLMRALGNKGGALPFSVLVDRHGRLAGRKLGAYTAAELRGALDGLIG
jgi:thiol-disulfide isomerase/thioredoxin